MKKTVILLAIVAAAVALHLCFSSAQGLSYAKSWREAREEARASGKPILLSFGGPW